MKVAICDNALTEIEVLTKQIDEYKCDFKVEYVCFTSVVELLSKISVGEFYDLIFLDAITPVVNGIDVAKEIYFQNKMT